MILKRFAPLNFGTFSQSFDRQSKSAEDTPLIVHPEVTILTGANDAGKSSVLRLLTVLYRQLTCDEHDRHQDLGGVSWKNDNRVGCWAEFEISASARQDRRIPDDHVYRLRYRAAPDVKGWEENLVFYNGSGKSLTPKFPEVVYIDNRSFLRHTFAWSDANETERRFLFTAFRTNDHKAISDLSEPRRRQETRLAEDRVNRRLARVLPREMSHYRFALTLAGGDTKALSVDVSLMDQFSGFTPIHRRGAGLQKIAALMAELAAVDTDGCLVLLDEPENSLHANAQHALRSALEQLAQSPGVQVIYSTHSPSMINTLRPDTVRVLQRQTVNDKPTTIFLNNATDKNFLTVRATLGVTPADSLLWGEVSLVVEGPTEVRCLWPILDKLNKAKVPGFDQVAELLARCFVVDGEGDSYERICRVASAQQCWVVVLLDGDKPEKKAVDGCVVIRFPELGDFEELVSRADYFEALTEIHELEAPAQELLKEFDQWSAGNPPKGNSRVFAARVTTWLQVTRHISLAKPRVMFRAVELAERFNEKHVDVLRDVVRNLRLSLRQVGGRNVRE